jgi:hypothetical protein
MKSETPWKTWAQTIEALTWSNMGTESMRADISSVVGVKQLLEMALAVIRKNSGNRRLYSIDYDVLDTTIKVHAMKHKKDQRPHIDGSHQGNFWSCILFITGGYQTFFGESLDVYRRIVEANNMDTPKEYETKVTELVDELLEMFGRADKKLKEYVRTKHKCWVPAGTLIWFPAGKLMHAGLTNDGVLCSETGCERITIYFAVSSDKHAGYHKCNTSESPLGLISRDRIDLVSQIREKRQLISKSKRMSS